MRTNGSLAPPVAGHVSATGGTGAITFQSMGAAPPSEVSIHAALSFPSGGPVWVPANEPLDADHVPDPLTARDAAPVSSGILESHAPLAR
jgi:hypothetical protein